VVRGAPGTIRLLWAGLKKKSADLQQLERQHADTLKSLEGSRRRLQEHEENWATKKRVRYEQQLERGRRRDSESTASAGSKEPSGSFPVAAATRGAAFKRQLQRQERERNQRRSPDRERGR
jgi:hypothetical protein